MELLKCEMEEKYYLVVDQTSENNALTYSIWREGTMQTIFYPSSTLETFDKGIFCDFWVIWRSGHQCKYYSFDLNLAKEKVVVSLLNF